ncbi:MAG: hypothetical protein OES13_09810 [Acidimicrobiia bacterium]|nr:hypothetical protein [Acidimicrobiia bacterium]
MAETNLDAAQGSARYTVTRSNATPRLGAAVAQVVIDDAFTKQQISNALDAIESDLSNIFVNVTRAGAPAFDDGAFFSDNNASFSDQTTL